MWCWVKYMLKLLLKAIIFFFFRNVFWLFNLMIAIYIPQTLWMLLFHERINWYFNRSADNINTPWDTLSPDGFSAEVLWFPTLPKQGYKPPDITESESVPQVQKEIFPIIRLFCSVFWRDFLHLHWSNRCCPLLRQTSTFGGLMSSIVLPLLNVVRGAPSGLMSSRGLYFFWPCWS